VTPILQNEALQKLRYIAKVNKKMSKTQEYKTRRLSFKKERKIGMKGKKKGKKKT
jgi:hypothetical protein